MRNISIKYLKAVFKVKIRIKPVEVSDFLYLKDVFLLFSACSWDNIAQEAKTDSFLKTESRSTWTSSFIVCCSRMILLEQGSWSL